MTQRRIADPENSVTCPSCGQPLTPQRWCPHCGAATSKRLRLSILRYISVLTALVGTVLVWTAARSTEVPTVRIADVCSEMDWAYVRLVGLVSRQPTHEPSSGQLAFWLDDGTGEIRVIAYRPVSDRLMEAPQLPAMGDQVAVDGTLRLREDLKQLMISLPSALDVERPVPLVLSIADLTEAHLLRRVCLRGQVRDRRVPYDGLAVIAMRDATAAVDVVAEEGLGGAYAAALSITVGEYVELCGIVTTYAGKLQVAMDPATVTAQRLAPVDIAQPREIAQIDHTEVGQFVRLRGTVSAVVQVGSGVKLLVEDTSGALAVVLWQDICAEVEDLSNLTVGSQLDVQGRVAEYRGQLELVPEIGGDILYLAQAGEIASSVELRQLGTEQVGDAVTVVATIMYSVPCPSGVRFGLQEGDTEGYLLAWSGWLAACPLADRLVPGAEVRLRGLVNLYEGSPEIVPQHPDDVVVTGMRARPVIEASSTAEPPPQQLAPEPDSRAEASQSRAPPVVPSSPAPALGETGTVTPGASGQHVTVQGTIVDMVLFASGQRCLIDDGSGPLALWLPTEPFAPVYGHADWGFGSTVRVRGLVQLYKEEPEVVPGEPADVSIVAPAPVRAEPVTRMSDLRESHVGERLTVEGRVVEVTPFSQGIKYLLDDGSGRLTLLLWQSVLDDLQGRECLALGSLVHATGRVSAYRGALELAPGVGRDVQCTP